MAGADVRPVAARAHCPRSEAVVATDVLPERIAELVARFPVPLVRHRGELHRYPRDLGCRRVADGRVACLERSFGVAVSGRACETPVAVGGRATGTVAAP